MTKSSAAALIALALFAAAGSALAKDPEPGTYKLTIERAAPCVLTLAADGGASLAADCARIKAASHWSASGNLVKLRGADDAPVALLKATSTGFVGTTVPDGLALAVTR